MAIEVKHVHTCDWPKCGRTSEQTRIRTFRIGHGGDRTKPADLDLCDEHAAPFDSALKVARKEKRKIRQSQDEMDAVRAELT